MLEGRHVASLERNGRKVTFRYPKWKDLPQYLNLCRGFHKDKIMASHRKTDRTVAAKALADILVRMETGRSRWLFMFFDRRLVGRGQVDVKNDLYLTIGLALAREARGMGLGRTMMELLEVEARDLKRPRLFLTVWAENPPAFNLYKKLGYREVGRREDWERMPDNSGRRSDLVEMVKHL